MKNKMPNILKMTAVKLISHIELAADTLKLLFAAWARYELENPRKEDTFL